MRLRGIAFLSRRLLQGGAALLGGLRGIAGGRGGQLIGIKFSQLSNFFFIAKEFGNRRGERCRRLHRCPPALERTFGRLALRRLSYERILAADGKGFKGAHQIDASAVCHKHPALDGATFTVACDVNNPFYGPNGAAHVFAPQKGANPTMVNRLDQGLRSLAQVIRKETGRSVDTLEGAGAAGGMGGGLVAFLGARLRPGIDLLLDALQFRQKAEGADLIITGEGKADRQSLMGKVPSGLLREAQALHIPIVLIAGAVEDQAQLNQAGFKAVLSIQPGPTTLEEAMRPEVAKARIQNTVEQICRLLTD